MSNDTPLTHPLPAYNDNNEVVVCGEKDKVVQTIAYLESECKKMVRHISSTT